MIARGREGERRGFMKGAIWILAAALCVASCGPRPKKALGPADLAGANDAAPTKVEAYGPDAHEVGDLWLPKGAGPFPVVVLIHGGCWTSGYATRDYLNLLAADLAGHGVAVWNIAYREVGDPGGGWPGTFRDWAAGADHLRVLARTYPLDLSRVVAVGHSAGAHAALWLAARERLAKASELSAGGAPLKIAAVVAIDGPGDIAGSILGRERAICGRPVIETLMGGGPAEVPRRYAQGNPMALMPVTAAETLVTAVVLRDMDGVDYQKAAEHKGGHVRLISLTNVGHFDMLSPATASGDDVERAILAAAGKPRP
jgi:acetyl esterase/lipase